MNKLLDPSADQSTAAALPAETPPKGKASWLMIAFASLVVVAETAVFFFLVPSAEEISVLAEARLVQSVQAQQADAGAEGSEEENVTEFSLGVYGETFQPIDTDRSFRVEMRIFGLVRNKNADKLKKEFDAKEGRLRHALRMKIRNSELSELTENQLGLLQRRILTTSNHILEGDLLLGIGFNDYQLIEE